MFVALFVVSGALIFSFSTRTPSSKLPDGSVIYVTGARVGFTNEFKHGNRIEKLLGTAISTNGWTIGKWTLKPPEVETFGWSTNAESLTIEFKITSPTNSTADPIQYRSFDRNYRILHWGDDGFRYTEEFPDRYFRKRRDGYFGYLQTSTYARTSPHIQIELQNRESKDGEWKRVAQFTIRNPRQTKPQAWSTQRYPVTNSLDGFTAVLGPIQVQQPRNNATPYPDIWQHAVDIPFKFFVRGQAVTNWAAEQMAVYDSAGNYNRFGTFKTFTNGWNVYRAWRSATPTVPWRLIGHLTPESDFAESDLFKLEIPFPLPTPFATNLAGLNTSVSFENGDMLRMRIPDDTSGRRFVLVDVLNELGESVKGWSGSWGQHGFMKQIDTQKVQSKVTVTVAIVRNIEFEFIVQPVLVEEISPPSEDQD